MLRTLCLRGFIVGLLALGIGAKANAVPVIWEPNFGAAVGSGDDSTFNVNWGFNFGFQGTNYNGGIVSTNGFLSLGGSNGSGCCDGSAAGLLNGNPRIAPAWYDLVTSVFLNTSVAGRAVITWQGPEFSNSTVNIFQAQLFANGDIIFGYDVLAPLEDQGGHRHSAIVGLSPGGGAADPGEIDFTTALPAMTGPSVYEFFARGPNGATGPANDTFDLAGTNICFNPGANNGWNVTGGRNGCGSVSVPEPATLALVCLGLAGFSLRRKRKA